MYDGPPTGGVERVARAPHIWLAALIDVLVSRIHRSADDEGTAVAEAVPLPPSAVEATMARTLGSHVALRADEGRITCLRGDWEGHGYPAFATHQAAMIAAALAARDEPTRPHPTRDDDYGPTAGQL